MKVLWHFATPADGVTFLNCDPAEAVLLGQGIRLHGNPGSEPIRLQRVGEGDLTSVVNVRYRPS